MVLMVVLTVGGFFHDKLPASVRNRFTKTKRAAGMKKRMQSQVGSSFAIILANAFKIGLTSIEEVPKAPLSPLNDTKRAIGQRHGYARRASLQWHSPIANL